MLWTCRANHSQKRGAAFLIRTQLGLVRSLFEFVTRASLANVPITEEELPAEIGLFDDVVICDSQQTARASRDAHHGKILQELAAQGTSAHKENLQILQLVLQLLSKYCNLAIIPAALQEQMSCVIDTSTNV